MAAFVIRRVAISVGLLIATSAVIFVVLHLLPGDPVLAKLGANSGVNAATVNTLRHELGLDKPIIVQYFNWVGGVLHGNFGRSYFSQYSVTTLIGQRIGATVELTLVSVAISVLIAVPLAVACAVRPGGIVDRITTVFASFGMAFPPFVAGILLILLFSVKLDVLPARGYVSLTTSFAENVRTITLPAITLAIVATPLILRYLRTQLIDELSAAYVRTAEGKGISWSTVVLRHALRNALVPALTMLGLIVGYTLGGVVIVEYVFGFGGLGSLAVQAALQRDYAVLQGVVLLISAMFLLTSLAVDLLSRALDPRLRTW